MTLTIPAAFEQAAALHRDKPAITVGATAVTYAELDRFSTALAAGLLDEGLRPGDRVVVQLPNRWEFVAVLLGCMRAGIAPVLVLPAYRARDLTRISALVDARALIVSGDTSGFDHARLALEVRRSVPGVRHLFAVGGDAVAVPEIRSLADSDAVAPPAPSDPEQTAFLLISSGTTGAPKVIPRTHRDYLYGTRSSMEPAGFGADTVYLAALPLAHTFPLGCPGVLGALLAGGRAVLAASPRPDSVFDLIQREGVTATAAVPAVVHRWLAEYDERRWDLSSLRVLQVGGARMSAAQAALAEAALGCRVQQVYGMSEGMLNLTRLQDGPRVVHHTQGRPLSELDEMRIVGPDGRDCPPGEPGELLVRGPGIFGGYYRAPELNAAAFTGGWFRTGDVVRLHPSGNLVVESRINDLINRAGEKISAAEIEDLLHQLPEVDRAAVVAVPDPESGERVCACIVPAAGCEPTVAGLRAALTQMGIAAFKLPERLCLIDEIPLTAIGKVDKGAIRRMARDAAEPRAATTPFH
jgi:2,3-dihydroxybenzoate-AMP ligase